MRPRVIIFVIILGLAGTAVTAPQLFTSDPTKQQFDKGVEAYNNQHYEQALELFQELYVEPGFNKYATATHLMLVKSYHKVGLERQSIRYGKVFISQYSSSNYLDDIYFAMAESYLSLQQYYNAANYFAYSITMSRDNALARIALDNLLKTADAYLTMEEVQALVDGAIGDDEANIFRLALLEEYILAGEMSLASTTAQELEQARLNDILLPTFRALKKAIRIEGDQPRLAIGVLAPFSGSSADVGKELLRGVRYALSKENELSRISVIRLDNHGSGLETVQQLQRIADHTRVIAVIGPVWSENVISGAALAGKDRLPLITPTAAGNGLAGLNEFIFQLSPDYETRGKAAAQYASDSLRLQTFATISPADPQGKALTDAFTAEVEKRGGEVVTQVWYSGIPEDPSEQFKHLRKVGFQLRKQYAPPIDTSQFVSDSLQATLPDSEFVALFKKQLEEYREEIDSTEITLKHIDGMYFPIRNSDIDYIAPQFALYNFDTQVLGNVDWYDEQKLQQYASYIDSMIIFSDHYIPDDQQSYQQFVTDFRKTTNASPSAIDLYGFDTMSLLLQLIKEGNSTRASIAIALREMHKVRGMARMYTLNGLRRRVNQSMEVLQYRRRHLYPLDVMTIGPRKTHPIESYFAE